MNGLEFNERNNRESSLYSSLFNIGDYVEVDNRRGWIIAKFGTTPESMHLNIFHELTSLFSGFRNNGQILNNHCSYTRHAFGVSETVQSRVLHYSIESDHTFERKVRIDNDSSVFNCDKKRKAIFTPMNVYKK